MPRRQRCVIEDVPHHITQRGVDRCPVFETETDRLTYLRLLRDHQCESHARLLGWCLMTNHVHLVILPERADSLALLLRRVHVPKSQCQAARFPPGVTDLCESVHLIGLR